MQSFQINKKNADIVLCVDTTGSMFNCELLEELKSEIKNLYSWYAEYMDANGCIPGVFRVKVIAFKDYSYDYNPMIETPFFTLSNDENDQSDQLQRFINSLEMGGGGDFG